MRHSNRHYRSILPPPAPLVWTRQTFVVDVTSRFNGQPVDMPLHMRRVLKCLLRGFGVKVREVRDGGEVGLGVTRDEAHDLDHNGGAGHAERT